MIPLSRRQLEDDLAAVIGNAEKAEYQRSCHVQSYRALPQGDKGLGQARFNVNKADAEAKHWRNRERELRIELGRLPPAQQQLPVVVAQRLPYADPDLPEEPEDPARVRETGADDDDDAPAWFPAVAGGAP